MKNLWKILAALLVVALPMLVASCGDDDEVDEIPTYTYKWELNGIDLNKVADEDQVATINARNTVNDLVARAYTVAGFTVDATNKKFTIETEKAVKDLDEEVQITYLTLKQTDAFKSAASVLPKNATILIQRGSTKVVNNTSLYNN